MERIHTDVLIIGAGAAGIRAALAASEARAGVLLVAKNEPGQSGATFSPVSNGWGIQALMGEERNTVNLEAFYDDIMDAGLGQCDPALVRILVEESGPRFEDLISCGLRFRKDLQGRYARVRGCFSRHERAYLTEDMANIRTVFSSILRRLPVKIITGYASELVIHDQECWGAWILDSTNKMVLVQAGSTILACGGGAGLFRDTLAGMDEIGDGCALAHRAGADCANLEFIQFMLGLKKGKSRRFLPLSDLRKPHMLRDSGGRDLLEIHLHDPQERSLAVETRLKHYPFSCRDGSQRVDLAVAQTRKKGEKIFWVQENAENIPIEVVHFAHAFNGGVKIDERARSTVPGLFAAGEVAAGPHGADRIGGCMMTSTQVFGERAGKYAANRARDLKTMPRIETPSESLQDLCRKRSSSGNEMMISSLFDETTSVFSHQLGLPRDAAGMTHALKAIEETLSHLPLLRPISPRRFIELRNQCLAMKLVTEAAFKRRVSLGPHYRSDNR